MVEEVIYPDWEPRSKVILDCKKIDVAIYFIAEIAIESLIPTLNVMWYNIPYVSHIFIVFLGSIHHIVTCVCVAYGKEHIKETSYSQ